MVERRTLRRWGYGAAGIVGAFPIMLIPLAVLGRQAPGEVLPDPQRVVVFTAAAAAAVIWAYVFAWFTFREADEFMREGSKFAWHWGGLAGIAASLPIYVFILMGGLHWLNPASPVGPELARAFRLGFALPVVAQLTGFLAVGAWWRMTKR